MNSYEYANTLRSIADQLEAKPEFPMPLYFGHQDEKEGRPFRIVLSYFRDKVRFLEAVLALGEGTKEYKKDSIGTPELVFTACQGQLALSIDRDKVCRIVKPAQPAEYECEPLLSQEETERIGA